MYLVELIAPLRACSPKAALAAMVSALSPCGVDVPCALTYCTSAVLMPPLRSALRLQRAAPSPRARLRGPWPGGGWGGAGYLWRVDGAVASPTPARPVGAPVASAPPA